MRLLTGVDRVLGPLIWVVAAAVVLMLFIGPKLIANDQSSNAQAVAPYAQQLFVTNCGSCHTLSAAGTSGALGPNLDGLGLPASVVASQVQSGGASMPAFAGKLDSGQISALADYVEEASAP
jgi:mono/diheme cytochrome c family protein